MGWAALISSLLEIFGPVLAEWLKRWLDSLLQNSAARLPAAESFGSAKAARTALFDEAISSTPRLAFARRGLLRRMKAHAEVKSLTGDAAEELRDLASAAASE